MSEYAWMRCMRDLATIDPAELQKIAAAADRSFDGQIYPDRELVWRQGFLHQLGKIACGVEAMVQGPYVQLLSGSGLPMVPIFRDDPEY